jgi:hypothetical protein
VAWDRDIVDVHDEEHAMLGPLLLAGFLVAHAAIHVAFVTPAPPATADGPAWPFSTADSWLVRRLGVEPAAIHGLGLALVALTLAGLALAAIVALGFAPTALWLPAIIIGATASLALLLVCFDPWLLFGVGIDVVLLYATLVGGWVPATASLT